MFSETFRYSLTNFDFFGRSHVRISRTELRGITLTQLEQLVAFISEHAHLWCETFEQSPDFGRPLEANSLNLYHAVHWLIAPATSQEKISFVELVAQSALEQYPQWFVSHAWCEAIFRFVTCLRHHALLRSLSNHSAYWVCAYANNQHKLKDCPDICHFGH